MKKLAIFAAAFVLTLGLAQCKKEQPATPQNTEGNKVHITVNVGNGSRAGITTPSSSGEYNFNNGDLLYVGYDNACVGTLAYNSETSKFSGNLDLTEAVEAQKLHFYYLGGGAATQVGETQQYTVDISDQTSNYPVISYGTSTKDYSTGKDSYTTVLLNQCGLVKFTSTNEIPEGTAVVVSGLNNKVEVNFEDNTLSYSQTNNGSITLHAENATSRWAILLPQTGLSDVKANAEGYDEAPVSFTVSEIKENDYLTESASFTLTAAAPAHEYVDLGLPSGLLWATCNVGADSPEDYGDYFAWGETQPKDYYDWSTYQYCHGSDKTLTKYCNNSKYGYNGFTDNLTTLLPEDDAATANWRSGWRMPTETEWLELYQNTTNIWTTQNGVNGRLFTASNGNSLFLPAAGYLDQDSLKEDGSWSYHWSSSLFMTYSVYARGFHFSSSYSNTGSAARYYGRPVRAVRSGSQN